jgi:hypothetical protein
VDGLARRVTSRPLRDGYDALPKTHGEVEYASNPTAQLISRAVADFGLVSERGGWVLVLHPDGQHVFRRASTDGGRERRDGLA